MLFAAALAAAALGSAGSIWAGFAPAQSHEVSQKGRVFQPGSLTIQRGDQVWFVNDDEMLLHHLYAESPSFSFDSGDQQPGTTIKQIFPVAGAFTVRCGIHPKMRLAVTVH